MDFWNNTKHMAGFTAAFLFGIGLLQVLLGEYHLKSVALTANGIDCIGDGFVSSIVWIGLNVFHKPADHKFHYGYFKLENLASIAAAVIMVILAIYISYRSYLQYTDPHDIQAPLIGIVVATVAALVAIILGINKYSRAKKTHVSSSKLEAINTIKDGSASVLAVVALILADAGILIADAIVGFIIAGIIISIAFAAIKEASLMLVDACDSTCIDRGLVLRNIMHQFPEVKASHMVKLRRTGPYYQGEMLIEVSGDMTITELDKLTKDMEDWAKKKIENLHNLTIKAVPHQEKE